MTAKELKKCRKKAGKTQKQFAEELGVSYDTYRGWELGRYKAINPLIEPLLKRLGYLD